MTQWLGLLPLLLAERWLRQGRLAFAAHALCASVYVTVTSTAYVTGGHLGPSLLWLSTLAWAVTLTRGLRGGLSWLIVLALTWIAFTVAAPLEVPVALGPYLAPLEVLSNLALIVLIGGLAIGSVYIADELTANVSEAETAAQRANEAKDAFLAMMSHQLRTPLTTVVGYTEVLAEESGDAGRAREADLADLDRIRLASQGLLAILNDILDVAQLGSGEVVMSPGPIELDGLEGELRATVEPLAKRRGNRFVVEFEPLPYVPLLDEGRIRQVLINLLGNACKFTENDSITLRLMALPEGWLRFEVEDTGIGMTEEQQRRVFHGFEQATEDTAKHYGGTGLGLAICDRLVRAMGGRIAVDSEPSRGTRFFFEIPGGVEASTQAGAA
ncbi:MAG: ATP-binding protein [Myxococcota bacterium]